MGRVEKRELPRALFGEGTKDRIVADESVRREAEHPLRYAELGLARTHGFDPSFAPAVEIPEVRPIGHEVERSVGCPFGLEDRLLRSPGDPNLVLDAAVASERADPQLGRVPGHVGVVPTQPAQSLAVGADPRRRVEFEAANEHAAPCIVPRDRKRDDRVDVLSALHEALVLAHADQPPARPVELVVGEPKRAFWRERLGRATRVLPVDSLVGEVREEDDTVANDVIPSAVFVHPRSNVEAGRGDVGDRPIPRAANEHASPLFGGPDLREKNVISIEGELSKSHGPLHDEIRRNGRLPRAAGSFETVARFGRLHGGPF